MQCANPSSITGQSTDLSRPVIGVWNDASQDGDDGDGGLLGQTGAGPLGFYFQCHRSQLDKQATDAMGVNYLNEF